MKSLRITKYVKAIKFEGVWEELESELDPKSIVFQQVVRQLVYTMLISKNRPSFRLW